MDELSPVFVSCFMSLPFLSQLTYIVSTTYNFAVLRHLGRKGIGVRCQSHLLPVCSATVLHVKHGDLEGQHSNSLPPLPFQSTTCGVWSMDFIYQSLFFPHLLFLVLSQHHGCFFGTILWKYPDYLAYFILFLIICCFDCSCISLFVCFFVLFQLLSISIRSPKMFVNIHLFLLFAEVRV